MGALSPSSGLNPDRRLKQLCGEKAPPQNSAAGDSRAARVAAGRSDENGAHAVKAGSYGPTFVAAACALSAQHVVLHSACAV